MKFVLSSITVDDVFPNSEKLETAVREQLAVIGMIRRDLNNGTVPEDCPDEIREGVLALDMDHVAVSVFITPDNIVGIDVQ